MIVLPTACFVAKAEIRQFDPQGRVSVISSSPIENAEFVGLVSTDPVSEKHLLWSKATYGIFRGSRLEYSSLSYGPLTENSHTIRLPDELSLQATLRAIDTGISVSITWQGQPLVQTKVKLFNARGEETGEVETTSAGVATFTKQQVQEGLNAIRVGHNTDTAVRWATKL